jgi:hypothetical protein
MESSRRWRCPRAEEAHISTRDIRVLDRCSTVWRASGSFLFLRSAGCTSQCDHNHRECNSDQYASRVHRLVSKSKLKDRRGVWNCKHQNAKWGGMLYVQYPSSTKWEIFQPS